MSQIRKDNKLMAMLSIWGILLVLIGHSGFQEPIIQTRLHGLHAWIYSFHMPLFFFISGFLFAYTNKNYTKINPSAFIKKKVVRLMVPYFVLGTIVFVIKYSFAGLSHAERTLDVSSFLYMFIAPISANSTMGYLWYLITLFGIFFIVTMFISMKVRLYNKGVLVILIALFGTLSILLPKFEVFNLQGILHSTPYFLLGSLVSLCRFDYKILYSNVLYLFGGVVCFLHLLLVFYIANNPILDYFSGVLGIATSIFLCSLLLKTGIVNKYILPYASMTYTIYLLSWFGHYAAKVIIVNILHLHWSICVIGMFMLGLAFPVIIYKVVNESKRLSQCEFLKIIIGC
jgi:hypothetical protein